MTEPTGGRTAEEQAEREAAVARSHAQQRVSGVSGSAGAAPASSPEHTAAPPAVEPSQPDPIIPEGTKPDRKGGQIATINGQKLYLPGMTQYESGWRTVAEYERGQKDSGPYGPHYGSLIPAGTVIVQSGTRQVRVTPGDYELAGGESMPTHIIAKVEKGQYKVPVTATSEKGKTAQLLLSKDKTESIVQLSPEKQFLELQKLGVYPANWEYQTRGNRGQIIERVNKQVIRTTGPKIEVSVSFDDRAFTELPGEKLIKRTELSKLQGENREQYELLLNKGFDEYKKEIKKSQRILAKYRTGENEYNIATALLQRDKNVTKAVEFLFPDKLVQDIKTKKRAGLTIGTGTPLLDRLQVVDKTGVPVVSEKITSPIIIRNKGLMSKLPPALLAAVGVTALTPIPGDEAVALAILAGTLGIMATISFIDKFEKRHKRLPKSQDIVLIKGIGEKARATIIDPETLRDLGGLHPLEPPREVIKDLPAFMPPKLRKLADTDLTPPQVAYLQEIVKKIDPEKVIILDPAITPSALGMDKLIRSQVITKSAERLAGAAVPKPVEPVPVDWDRIFDMARGRRTAEDIDKALKEANTVIKQNSGSFDPKDAEIYSSAYAEYLKKRAILAAARKQFVAALDPAPIKGTIDNEIVTTAAGLRLLSALGYSAKGASSTALQNALQVVNSDFIDKLLKTYTQTLTKALELGKTQTKAQAQAELQLGKTIDKALQTLTVTSTSLATRALPDVLTRTGVATAVTPAVRAARVAARPTVATARSIGRLERPPPPRILPPRFGKLSDKKKRKIIRASDGALGWRMGELNGQDIYHVGMYPYENNNDWLTVRGKKPANMTLVKGPGSAYQTIRLLYGKTPARKIRGDMGIIDFLIEPKGGRRIGIGFTPDPKQETTGDITIGKSRVNIPTTNRTPRLSGRSNVRITPPRPRIER